MKKIKSKYIIKKRNTTHSAVDPSSSSSKYNIVQIPDSTNIEIYWMEMKS